ncbi:MAG: class I tRNA ligase family protein, partial [Collinsella sp.]|nr:class I tRNA ligase family protein [Collinsella sp.]
MAQILSRDSRPDWPRRAVVTAGMPYGNKGLHFGHVGGVFVPADFYARFLRDRLGRENVIFVSGTDCFGSPIMEGFRKKLEAEGYAHDISDYVRENHDSQERDLASFGVSCDLYAGSALDPAAPIHERMTEEIVCRLHERGKLTKLSTKQFFDPKAGQFLNGRQVLGRCPIQGCKSEKAYADECDLGHQFEPEELIAPKSALTGETPELVPVDNLYFDLPSYLEFMREHTSHLEGDPSIRAVVSKTMREWLDAPQLYIQVKFRDDFEAIRTELPSHELIEAEGGKGSFTVVFPTWRERDEAHEVLNRAGVRFRSGKALVPFRITGNVEWGVPVPDLDGCRGLTCWVWPESLWAPISFTRAVLARDAETLRAQGADGGLSAPALSDGSLVRADAEAI